LPVGPKIGTAVQQKRRPPGPRMREACGRHFSHLCKTGGTSRWILCQSGTLCHLRGIAAQWLFSWLCYFRQQSSSRCDPLWRVSFSLPNGTIGVKSILEIGCGTSFRVRLPPDGQNRTSKATLLLGSQANLTTSLATRACISADLPLEASCPRH
jgi:hypothetical protein